MNGPGSPGDRATREALLDIARAVVHSLRGDQQATKQAATARAVLLRDGIGGLERALGASFDGGGTATHWNKFRGAFGPRLPAILERAGGDPAAVAFTLGWVHRLGKVDAHRQRVDRPRRGGRR